MRLKKAILLLCGILTVAGLGGCASIPTAEFSDSGLASSVSAAGSLLQQQNISKVEVYSAESGRLLKTIREQSLLEQFLKKTVSDVGEAVAEAGSSQDSSGTKPHYRFIVYKKSSSAQSSGDEELYRLTTYADSDAIQLKISRNAVKNVDLPDSLLTFTAEVPADMIQYLNSFAS